MALSLLRVREVDMCLERRRSLIVVCENFMTVRDLTFACRTHRKTRQGKQFFDWGYKIHPIARDGVEAVAGHAEIILHIYDEEGRFESHDEQT